jgi:hypothetical protein
VCSVVKLHHELSSMGKPDELQGHPSYSQLVDVAGRAVADEIAVLLQGLQHADGDARALASMRRLCWIAAFSETVSQSVHMKLMPVLREMICDTDDRMVARASASIRVLCRDSPHLACMVCATGLLDCIIAQLSHASSHADASAVPRARRGYARAQQGLSMYAQFCILEMLESLAAPSYVESPYSILLAVLASWLPSELGSDDLDASGFIGACANSVCELFNSVAATGFRAIIEPTDNFFAEQVLHAFAIECQKSTNFSTIDAQTPELQQHKDAVFHFVSILSFMTLDEVHLQSMVE